MAAGERNDRLRGHRPDELHCGAPSPFRENHCTGSRGAHLYRTIRDSTDIYSLDIDVRLAADDDVNNRIRLTTHLMTQNRLFLTDDCEVLAKAFTSALWAERSSTNPRSDASDVGTLTAFEYTIERESSRFVQS